MGDKKYRAEEYRRRNERYHSDPVYRAKRIVGRKKRTSDYQKRLRIKALYTITGDTPKCKWCGIDDVRVLEIHHKNGNGSREVHSLHGAFYRNIVKGIRQVDDLDVLCKVCNIIHFVKMKFNIDWKPVINING